MDKEDIKLHLAGYRPELYDDDDPQIAAALAAAKADPELSQWLDEQIAFDREFAASLTGLAPRDEARDSLLGAPASAADLRAALHALGDADGWSEDDAREWWAAHPVV